jgi:hypothetical protein
MDVILNSTGDDVSPNVYLISPENATVSLNATNYFAARNRYFKGSREERLQRENLNPLGAFILGPSGKSIS